MVRIVKLVISIGFYIALRVHIGYRKIMGHEPSKSLVVIYYHSIRSDQRQRFARQLDDLLKYARPVPTDFNAGSSNGLNCVAVTFDDGLASVVENAVPELIRRKIPATIFVPTGYMGKGVDWYDPPFDRIWRESVMTGEQLRSLPENIISVGSHSISHKDLTLLSHDQAWIELQGSKQELERILKKEIILFSFPYGEYNSKLVEQTRRAGYRFVFTTDPALMSLHNQKYLFGRISVDPSDWRLEFRLKVQGCYSWLPRALALKKRVLDICNKEWTGLRQ
jgi:peptidoglycan/xylan/chitin deacetylase (PgdA/CDA1 family)